VNANPNEPLRMLSYRVREDGRVEVDFDLAVDRRLTVTVDRQTVADLGTADWHAAAAAIAAQVYHPPAPEGEV